MVRLHGAGAFLSPAAVALRVLTRSRAVFLSHPRARQINCKLCAPIAVGAELIIEGEIERREGRGLRKCFIVARLVSDVADAADEVVHATCEGLFIMSQDVAAAAAADGGGGGAAAAAATKAKVGEGRE